MFSTFFFNFQGLTILGKPHQLGDDFDNSGVERSTLVANHHAEPHRFPDKDSTTQQDAHITTGAKSDPQKEQNSTPVCSKIVQKLHQTKGFSQEATAVIMQIRSAKTYVQYSAHIERWITYAQSHNIHPLEPLPFQVTNFLEHYRLKSDMSFSAVNTARSALSSIITYDKLPVGQHPDVTIYMQALEKLKPKTPRYQNIWDPGTVLRYLTRWSPARLLDMKLLSHKLLMLLLLATGQRIQTISKLNINNLQLKGGKAIFRIDDKLKTSKPGIPTYVTIKEYPANRSLCPIRYLKEYIKRTKSKRTSSTLFIACNKPYHRVTTQTLSRWTKTVLKVAGISNAFGAHSTRSASTTSAFYSGVSIDFIMDCASWSSADTFRRWYQKPVRKENNFQVKVFDSHKRK